VALSAFKLNGQFLELAEGLARPAGLTAAWWQVLGAVLPAPLPVAAIAREMGITRQSVQRIADLLVSRGLAAYQPNPAHRRAKLVTATAAGRACIAQINPAHWAFAQQLVRAMGRAELTAALESMRALSEALDRVVPDRAAGPV
jgi:DNA-binding MarR family transcriptional regulator